SLPQRQRKLQGDTGVRRVTVHTWLVAHMKSTFPDKLWPHAEHRIPLAGGRRKKTHPTLAMTPSRLLSLGVTHSRRHHRWSAPQERSAVDAPPIWPDLRCGGDTKERSDSVGGADVFVCLWVQSARFAWNCMARYGQLVVVFHWLTIRCRSLSVEP